MKNIDIGSPFSPDYSSNEELVPLVYPGELLSDMIQRAISQGVNPEATVSLQYDEDDSDEIDPDCDIRTDFFALAENAEAQRTASRVMTEKADAQTVVPIPVVDPVDLAQDLEPKIE